MSKGIRELKEIEDPDDIQAVVAVLLHNQAAIIEAQCEIMEEVVKLREAVETLERGDPERRLPLLVEDQHARFVARVRASQ